MLFFKDQPLFFQVFPLYPLVVCIPAEQHQGKQHRTHGQAYGDIPVGGLPFKPEIGYLSVLFKCRNGSLLFFSVKPDKEFFDLP